MNTAGFEFSLRGQWPVQRYRALIAAQSELIALMVQLQMLFRGMSATWKEAVLERCMLTEEAFVGDILSTIAVCSFALETARPLPHITTASLWIRLVKNTTGLSTGVPEPLSYSTFMSEDFMHYATASTIIFGIAAKIDRLVLLTKNLCGEDYGVMFLHKEGDSSSSL